MTSPPRRRRDPGTTHDAHPPTASTSTSASSTVAAPEATDRTPISYTNGPDYMSITPHASGPGEQSSGGEGESEESEEAPGRWAAFWEKYGSVSLENKGSVARDHLALERTFLAWLRTSLSFASIGIAITQLFRLNSSLSSSADAASSQQHHDASAHLRRLGKPLGATFLGIAILTLGIGFHRYFEAQHYVIRGKFPAARGSIVLITVVAGALVVCALAVIVAAANGGRGG